MINLRQELERLRLETGVVKKEYYTDEEAKQFKELKNAGKPLPDGILFDRYDNYYKNIHTDLSEQELSELFLYRQTKYLYSIKNSMIFFVVLTILSIITSILLLL